MSRNLKVVDIKPKTIKVADVKPKNIKVDTETEQYYSMTLAAGQPMGLLLAITYPTEITVSSSKSP